MTEEEEWNKKRSQKDNVRPGGNEYSVSDWRLHLRVSRLKIDHDSQSQSNWFLNSYQISLLREQTMDLNCLVCDSLDDRRKDFVELQ